MSRFLTRASLTPTSGGWFSIGEQVYEVGAPGSGSIFRVPSGTFTNLADIPAILWPILPRDDPEFAPSVLLHDWLCRDVAAGDMSRTLKDAIFYDAMKLANRPAWRRKVMYQGVRFWALLKTLGLRR